MFGDTHKLSAPYFLVVVADSYIFVFTKKKKSVRRLSIATSFADLAENRRQQTKSLYSVLKGLLRSEQKTGKKLFFLRVIWRFWFVFTWAINCLLYFLLLLVNMLKFWRLCVSVLFVLYCCKLSCVVFKYQCYFDRVQIFT